MSDQTIAAEPTPPIAPPANRWWHRRWRLVVSVSVLVVLATAAVAYAKTVVFARPLAFAGGEVAVKGPGVTNHQDPFLPNSVWYSVAWTSGGKVRMLFTITNVGQHDVHVTSLNFGGLPQAAAMMFSPLRSAEPLMGYSATRPVSDNEMTAFKPFTLPAGKEALVGWDMTMCIAPSMDGGDSLYEIFKVTYTYGGWHRTDEIDLPSPIAFDNVSYCDRDGRYPRSEG